MDINKHRRSVHSLYIKILCQELAQQGIAVEDSLKAAHLPQCFINEGAGMVSVYAFQRLIDFARTRTGMPWLGLALGAKIVTHHHGPLGYLMTSSANLNNAIDALITYVTLRTHLLTLSLSLKHGEAHLTLHEGADIDSVRVVFLEAFLVVTLDILRLVFGRPIPGLRLQLSYKAPDYALQYSNYFSCPVQFGCAENRITFQHQALASKNIMADPKACQLADIECQNLLDRYVNQQGLRAKIEQIVLEPENLFPPLDRVAERVGMSKSTLIRKLANEGTSYKHVIDTIRQELASYYLIETTLPMEKIAEKLGYADTSNFSRVFQRWTHTTPSMFRTSKRNTAINSSGR